MGRVQHGTSLGRKWVNVVSISTVCILFCFCGHIEIKRFKLPWSTCRMIQKIGFLCMKFDTLGKLVISRVRLRRTGSQPTVHDKPKYNPTGQAM